MIIFAESRLIFNLQIGLVSLQIASVGNPFTTFIVSSPTLTTRRKGSSRQLGVVNGLGGPEVGVVADTAVFVGSDRLVLQDPFVDGERDVFQGDELLVNDGGFVVHFRAADRVFGLGKFHLGDPVAAITGRRVSHLPLFHRHAGMAGHGLVVQMPMGEIAAGLGKGAEIRIGPYAVCFTCRRFFGFGKVS